MQSLDEVRKEDTISLLSGHRFREALTYALLRSQMRDSKGKHAFTVPEARNIAKTVTELEEVMRDLGLDVPPHNKSDNGPIYEALQSINRNAMSLTIAIHKAEITGEKVEEIQRKVEQLIYRIS